MGDGRTAELKGRKRKRDESMAELGRDLARLVQLAYLQAVPATRETLAINASLDAPPILRSNHLNFYLTVCKK